MAQQEMHPPDRSQGQQPKRKKLSRKQRTTTTIIIGVIIALVIAIVQVLSSEGHMPKMVADISSGIALFLGLLYGLVQILPILHPSESPQPTPVPTPVPPTPPYQIPPITIHISPPEPQQPQPVIQHQPAPEPDKPPSGNINGFFPPTNPTRIEQRQKVVEEVYDELMRQDINCIALTGIGGIGKSTVAALVYNYIEQQRKQTTTLFTTESFWFTLYEATTFSEVAQAIVDALDKKTDVAKLLPQQQAAALFHALNTTDKPRLIVINQFEYLLDAQTGQGTAPGVGEWLDILNSRECRCHVLLTSRIMPEGEQNSPQTLVKPYPVIDLSIPEGVELLRKQGVMTEQGTVAELQEAVRRCSGHALSLELLATILRDDPGLSLSLLLHDRQYAHFWSGKIATKLLDVIYTKHLSELQRHLLLAFSIYREPVPVAAAQALFDSKDHMPLMEARQVLLDQHLLQVQATGTGRYLLHTIVDEYAHNHFAQSGWQTLQEAHSKAAQYYIQVAEKHCPLKDKRRSIDDIQPLIEAFWQYGEAEQWQRAYELEDFFDKLSLWGNNVILLELCQMFLPFDKWQPEPRQKAYICSWVGRVYNGLGDKPKALDYYQQALVIRREVGDRGGEGTTLNNLGGVYDDLGDKPKALDYYQQALAIHKQIGNRTMEGITLHNIGAMYFEKDNYLIALAFFILSRDIFIKVQSPDDVKDELFLYRAM